MAYVAVKIRTIVVPNFRHRAKRGGSQTARYQIANNGFEKESAILILIIWMCIVKNHAIDAKILLPTMGATMVTTAVQVGHSRENAPQIQITWIPIAKSPA